MSSFRFSFIAASFALGACAPQAQSHSVAPAASCQPLQREDANTTVPAISNGTTLVAEPLPSPTSAIAVRFQTPELAQEIAPDTAEAFEVRLAREPSAEAESLTEVALDAGRPRRLSAAQSSITLGQLLAAGSELGAGEHWLFAAAVVGSGTGLVPRSAPGQPRAATARRFFIGKRPASAMGPTSAIWLRAPEGTYNGVEAAARVLFDVFVFSASGAPLDSAYTIALHGPKVDGELRLPSPFSVRDVPSGAYRVVISAPSAAPSEAHFSINRELGSAP